MISKNCNAMKNIFSKIMLLAVAATAFASCAKDAEDTSIDVKEKFIEVTLKAEKPATVRTEMIDGIPHWSIGDAIGVYLDDTNKHYQFTNDSEEATLTTTFSGQTAVTDKLYPYYPYTSNGAADKGAKVDIPVNQNPTATSFDGAADIMIAKPITLDAEGTQLANLEFARVGAIVKIVLKDNTSSLAAQHISSLTMTAESNLVGRVYLDVINQQLGELYYGQSKSVTATYTEDTQFVVNGENAVYVIVYPQTLSADTTLAFEASTEHYAIAKEITLPNDIALEMGKVTTLNVSLTAEHLTAEESGLALPISDDFAWATGTSGVTPSGELWSSDYSYIYGANGSLRLGKSGECGYITTNAIDLSKPFTVIVDAKAWTTETSQVAVTVGDNTQTSSNLNPEDDGFSTYMFKFDAAGLKQQIKIAITGKRGYIDNLKVVAGHDYVLPPVLTVSKSEISGVSHEGTTDSFTYSVVNPVEGTNVVISDDAEWITTSDASGTVTVTIAANDVEEAREGTISIKYGDLTETITVTQNAKPAAGEAVINSVTYTVSSTSACTTSGTAPTGSSASYEQTYTTKEQLTSGKSATFTLSGYAGATIKAITLNMKSNASKGAGTFSAKAGSTTLAEISSATNFNKWYDNTSFGSTFRDIHVTMTNDTYVVGSGENVVITIAATTNSIYIHSVTIDYAMGSSEGGDDNTGEGEGGNTGEGEGGAKTYTLTIDTTSFNSTSYAANNNEKTSTAVAEDGSTMEVKWTSYQVMLQSSVMQWQKNNGYIYNSTDLGTITDITVTSTSGTFTEYIGSAKQPTSNGTGGYFQIKVGSATGKTSEVVITFTK